jgi:hypothetical protein
MSGPVDIRVQIRPSADGQWVVAYLVIDKRDPIEMARIGLGVCDNNREVFEDFQALASKCMVDTVERVLGPGAVVGLGVSKPGDSDYSGG